MAQSLYEYNQNVCLVVGAENTAFILTDRQWNKTSAKNTMKISPYHGNKFLHGLNLYACRTLTEKIMNRIKVLWDSHKKTNGVTQLQAAEELGWSQSTLSHL